MEKARQQVLEMKDELVQDFQKIRDKLYYDDDGKQKRPKDGFTPVWVSKPEGKEWLQKVDAFFDILINEVADTNTSFDEICDEIYIITRTVDRDGNPVTLDLETCSKEAFNVAMIRECLKNEKLLMQYSLNWKHFAKNYTKYVMDAI